MKQEVIGGILLSVIGLSLLFVPPNVLWTITEKWKTKGGGEPSRNYAILMRILGIVFAGAGGALLVCGLK